MSEINVKSILSEFEKLYPNVLNKAFNMFKKDNFKNFSIQDANMCLLGCENDCPAKLKPIVENLRLFTLWQYDKVEFEFDANQIKELTISPNIERRKLNRQPFKSYYVKLNNVVFDGFFVAFKYYFLKNDMSEMFNSNEIFLSLVMHGTKQNIYHLNFNIDVLDSVDLEESLYKAYYRITGTTPKTDKNPKEIMESIISYAVLAINIIYHISDLNSNRSESFSLQTQLNNTPNITPEFSSDYSRKFILSSNSSPNSINNYNEQLIEDEDLNKNHSGKHPHVRSGHWHHYWVGKKGSENRKRIVKWLESTTVNCYDRSKLPNVIIKP